MMGSSMVCSVYQTCRDQLRALDAWSAMHSKFRRSGGIDRRCHKRLLSMVARARRGYRRGLYPLSERP
jgi:hypothetical protein